MNSARLFALAAASLLLAGCAQSNLPTGSARSQVPIPPSTMALMSSKGMSPSDPILIRAYKKESEMEVWKRGRDGRYAHLKTLPICRWSGQLGPKVRQGDRQAPEGFYTVTPAQMNPNSAYYLSFDTGFPNAYDRAQGASGAHLMVHGTCSSAGCYAMTDEGAAELYALAREAFAGGQRAFQFQAYPFRMTAENMAKYRADPSIAFWQNLKEGSDRFEATREEPQVAVASGRYLFSVSPEGEALAARKMAEDAQHVAALVGSGVQAVRTAYADGDQHPSFQGFDASTRNLGEVSRPEALAYAGQDVPVQEAPTEAAKSPVQVAAGEQPPKVASVSARKADTSRPSERPRTPATAVSKKEPSRAKSIKATTSASARVSAVRHKTIPLPAKVAAGSTGFAPADGRPFYERWFGGLFKS
jgi:murein L,D-transpeptidase YafK